jgi:hypothetical protein
VAEEFTCAVDEIYRSACKDLPKYSGSRYCVLHEPDEAKDKEDFLKVKESKLARKDYDFGGTVFPEGTADFEGFEFDADAAFDGATFVGAANFRNAQFSGEGTSFIGAQFSGEWIDFSRAQFSSAYTSFASATFTQEVRFSSAIFRERVEFWGTVDNPVFSRRAWVWFDSLIVEPQLLTFHTVLLHPGWFINTDVRNVDFTDVKWYGMPGGPEGTLNEEIGALTMRDIESPYPLLSEACQRLSANAEENHAYPLANEFHYWRMDALRKGRWNYFEGLTLKDMTRRELWRYIGEHVGLITTLYWALSGYGVRASRALGVLAAIWLTFAAVYFFLVESSPFWVFSASDIWQGIDYARQAAAYSLSALVRLNPSPQSENLNWFQTLVIIEGILGPLQIALTTLAVRRMVMGMSLPTSEK